MAEEEPAGDVLRHLVHGRGRVDVPRPERLDEWPHGERAREIVRVRVSDVDGDRIRAVLRHDVRKPSRDLAEGLLPTRLHVNSVAAQERPTEAVGIVVERAEGRPLRADVPLREGVVDVAADPGDASVLGVDAQPAGGLTEGARAERHAGRHGMTIQPRPDRAEALASQLSGVVLVDIRSEGARERDGIVPGSVHVPRSVVEWRADLAGPWQTPCLTDVPGPLILICEHGWSSSLAAATLRRIGHGGAGDVVGGFEAWQAAGLPVAPASETLPGMGGRPDGPPGPRDVA